MKALANYKTTALGVAAILGALAHLINALANGDTSTILQDFGTISAGLAGVFAKDWNVTGGTKHQ